MLVISYLSRLHPKGCAVTVMRNLWLDINVEKKSFIVFKEDQTGENYDTPSIFYEEKSNKMEESKELPTDGGEKEVSLHAIEGHKNPRTIIAMVMWERDPSLS